MGAMERADIGIVVIDAKDGLTAQDAHIAGYVVEAGRGLVLVLNKWDLLAPEEKEEKVWRKQIKDALSFAPWAPISDAVFCFKKQKTPTNGNTCPCRMR